MSGQKLFCEVWFRIPDSDRALKIAGEVDKKQLFSQHSDWITVQTKILRNNEITPEESFIHKASVDKVVVLRPNRCITFDKESLGANELISKDLTIG